MNKEYFTIVKNPSGAKPGDILVWKKESGKVPKLHLSPASMRQFGISVGRRWRALSYKQVSRLVRAPADTRYYVITDTTARTRSRSESALSFDESSETLSRAVITEFPMDPVKTADGEYAPGFGRVVYENLISHIEDLKGVFGGKTVEWSSVVGSTPIDLPRMNSTDDQYSLDQALVYLVEGSHYRSSNPVFGNQACIPQTHAGADVYDAASYVTGDGYINLRGLAQLAESVMTPIAERNGAYPDEFTCDVPAAFLLSAVSRGAVLLRPTEDFWKYWSTRFAQTIERDCYRCYQDVIRRLAVVRGTTEQCLKLVKGRQTRLNRNCLADGKTCDRLMKGIYDGLGKI